MGRAPMECQMRGVETGVDACSRVGHVKLREIRSPRQSEPLEHKRSNLKNGVATRVRVSFEGHNSSGRNGGHTSVSLPRNTL
eukprot:scaffold24_cov341-Pavlova_lutheri.AAC.51